MQDDGWMEALWSGSGTDVPKLALRLFERRSRRNQKRPPDCAADPGDDHPPNTIDSTKRACFRISRMPMERLLRCFVSVPSVNSPHRVMVMVVFARVPWQVSLFRLLHFLVF